MRVTCQYGTLYAIKIINFKSIKMTPKEKAKELFQRHYQILIDADSDISAEIMISLLSIKAALLTVNEIFYDLQVTGSNKQIKFWAEVETELKEM